MKQGRKEGRKVCLSLLLISLGLLSFFASCEIGLGPSVDTEAPVVNITYPPSLAIIRDSFVLGGTWSDDKSLSSIAVDVYKNSDNSKTKVYSTNAAIASDGNWSVNLNNYSESNSSYYNGWQFSDGEYEIQVTAYDDGGHSSGVASRAFTIDNTPPVLVLTKPTSVGNQTAKTYGRTVQLEGTFSEDCTTGISSLLVSFYDSTGAKICDSSFESITDMSNANPLIVAQYYDAESEPSSRSENYQKWQNYQALYGSENISKYRDSNTDFTSQIYFTVTASDAAKTYKNVGDSGTGKGNETSTFYRGTTEMLNLINKRNDEFSDFSVAALKNYLNKTDSKYLSSATLAEILKAAESSSSNTSGTESISDCISNTSTNDGNVYPTFSMNPNNNPAYTVSGLAITPSGNAETYTEGYYNYYSGSTINVALSSGLDLTNLDTSTISIYYTDESDDSATPKLFWTWNKAEAIRYAKMNYLNLSSDEVASAAIDANPSFYRYTVTDASQNDDSLSVSSKLETGNSEITTGGKYKFSIVGKDINEQALVASDANGFGFFVKSNSQVPALNIDSYISNDDSKKYTNMETTSAFGEDVLKNGKFKFSGTIFSDSEDLTSATYTVKLNSVSATGTLNLSQDTSKTNYTYNWDFAFTSNNDMNFILNTKGLYTLELSVSATNGGGTVKTTRIYYLDNVDPTVSNVAISTGYTKNSVIYINNTKPFTLSGLCTDNYLISSVKYTFTGKDSSESDKTLTGSIADTTSWSVANVSLSEFVAQDNADDVTLTVTAIDKAGNESTSSYKIEFDTTAPLGKHLYDNKNKDLIFRIGEYDNDLDELKNYDNSISALDPSLDKDVGGKYSAGTWGTAQTITIRGDWIEEGSGLQMIYYKIFDSEPNANAISSFTTNYATQKDGYFAPLGESVKKRVSYTLENGNKNFAEVEYSFKNAISGFNSEHNYLLLLAVDNVGNAGIDTLKATKYNDNSVEENTTWNSNLSSISINVDTESPTLSCTSHSGSNYTNKVTDITNILGTVNDNASGVASVSLAINNKKVLATLDGENQTSATWSAKISASEVLSTLNAGNTYNVNATVTDAAGNSSSSTIFTLQVDTVSPSVSISSPVVSSTINSNVDILGTASYDGAGPSLLQLYYTTSAPTSGVSGTGTSLDSMTKIGSDETDVSKIYSWKFEDFDSYSVFSDSESALASKDIYLVPVIYDTAGNCNIYTETNGLKTYSYTEGTNYFKYTVDKNSDRPIIKVTNLSKNSSGSYVLKYGTNSQLTGTITDDDSTSSAVVEEFIASSTSFTVSSGTVTGNKGTTSFDKTTGEWTFTPSETSDGSKNVYFYVKDNKGREFYTTYETSAFGRPYFQYKSEEAIDNNSVISYLSDSTSPSIASASAYSFSASGANAATSANEESATGLSLSLVLGGKQKKYAQFVINASDANGIAGMTYSLSGEGFTSINRTTASSIAGLSIDESYTVSNAQENSFSASGENATWTTEKIDLSSASGTTLTLTVNAYDNCALLGNGSYTFSVDNAGPTITITSPSSSDELTGDITFAGASSDNGNAGVVSTKWLIPTTTEAEKTDAELFALNTWNDSLDSEKTETIWVYTLDADTLSSYDNATYAGSNILDGIYTLPFYVMSVDSLGNCTIKRDYTIKHNPDGDRPKTTISYPDSTGSVGSGTVLGGTIRITGESVIPSLTTSVGAVYIQIATMTTNTSTPQWGSSDKTKVSNDVNFTSGVNNGGYGYKVSDSALAQTDLGVSNLTFASGNGSDWWGIKATKSSSSWSIYINLNGEMDPASNSINYIAVRACAINAEGKVGAWTEPYYINVDATAPTQTATLRQYQNTISQSNADSNIQETSASAIKSFSSQMYLKGDWYLTVKLYDESSIYSYSVKKGNSTLTENSDYFTSSLQTAEDSSKSRYLFIPVDKTSSSVTYTVTVIDAETNGHTITNTYDLNIDNTAPTIESVYKGSSYNAQNLLNTNSSNTMTDSNYVYTFGGKVDETGSGFERTLFFFVRENSDETSYTTPAILDPILTGSEGDSYSAKIPLSSLVGRTVTQGENSYTMYGFKQTGTLSEDTFVCSSSVASNTHIRVGGLIEVAGLLHKITDIGSDGKTITFETSTGLTSSVENQSAYFIYGQVVDNTTAEKTSDTTGKVFAFTSGDDGDLMPEGVSGSKSIGYTWDATIKTTNIPDGPAVLRVLAFDKAGNVSCNDYPVSVENSAPRLAKLYLGTDLNSSGTYTSNEFVGYDVYNANASAGLKTTEVRDALSVATANFGGSAFTIKNNLAVVPEIVGGNGNVIMVYKKGAEDTSAITKNEGKNATENSSLSSAISGKIGTVSYNNVSTETSLLGFTLTNKELLGTEAFTEGDDGTSPISLTFWDSTDELTQGINSQKCVIRLSDINFDVTDGVAPKVVVNPFYWESSSQNSLYNNSKDNGHIELEADWKVATGYSSATSGTYDSDPKVSGIITFTGTVYDDHSLRSLSFTLKNSSGTAYTGFSNVQMATYTGDSGWSKTSGNSGSAIADGGKYEWEIFADDSGVEITEGYYEDTYYLAQGGHKIYWTLSIDTAQIDTVAANDVTLTVTASDGTNSSSSSTASAPDTTSGYSVTDGTTHVPSYRMDVVPYITDVKRNSGYNTHRSGMGNYPLMRGETGNSVTGFNLGTSATANIYVTNNAKTLTGTQLTDVTVNGNTATFTVPDTAVDGYLQYYVVSGTENVPALNNMNNNATYTKEDGDTRWYDDRYVRIWQSNASDKFAASYPTYPAMAMGSNGDLYMSYTFYSKSVVYYNKLMSDTKTQIFTAGDQPEETDIMINGENEVNVIYQANHHLGGSQQYWTANANGAGSINLYNPSAPECSTYAKGRYWRFEGFWHNQLLQQLKNAKVATSGNDVYHTVWYDKITKAIKYSNVTKSANQYDYVPNNDSNPAEIGWVVLDGDADLDDIVMTNQRTTNGYNGGEDKYPNNPFDNSYLNGVGNESMYSVALSKTPAQREAIMNLYENSSRKDSAINKNGNYNLYDYTGGNSGTTGYNADCYEDVSPASTCGEYAAICVTSSGYPIVVYYDIDHNMLKVARGISTNPKGMNTANTDDGAAVWRIQQVPLTSGHIGNDASYVSAVIDSAGYLHIAFQNSRGELIYTRSTNTTSKLSLTQGFTFGASVIVDTKGIWASITVDSKNVPQIAYMANTAGYDTLKLAYPVESETALWTAATTWETMYAPINAKSSNVKTCVVARPSGKTGGQPTTQTDSYWKTGIGFATSEDYRVMKYIGSGAKEY